MSLKAELNAILGVAFAVALAVTGATGATLTRRFYRVEVVEARGRLMARLLAPPCVQALARGTHDELDRLLADQRRLDAAGGEALVLAIAVLDEKGEVRSAIPSDARHGLGDDPIARAARAAEDTVIEEGDGADGLGLRFGVPLKDGGRARGVLWFELSLERTRTLQTRSLAALTAAGLAVAGLLWLTLYKLVKRRILAPVLEVSRAMERVRGGDLTARLGGTRGDEIGSLVASFDELVAALRERQAMEKKLDEAERVAEAHRRLAEAHKDLAESHMLQKVMQDRLVTTEKHAATGRLVQGVAHEIMNPLNAVSGALPAFEAAIARLKEKLQPGRAIGPEEQAELDDLVDASRVIARGVGRAVAIVRDLRAFSRLGSADLASVDLRKTIDEAVEACAQELGPEGRIAVEVDVASDGGPIVLRAFPTLLLQVFVNLITNAAQAIPAKGRVTIRARTRGDRIEVTVRDDGPGIPQESLKRIFEPFFTTKVGKGSGLGLALCFGIVEKHGGLIRVESEPGKGATFTVELPREARTPAGDGTGSALLEARPGDSIAAVAAQARRG